MVSIAQLTYIVALHRFGHFGEAARECGVSQPTLSAQIKKAEAQLGITLFHRKHHPVSVTERGAAVIEQAQVVIAAHERMLRLARGRFEERAGQLRLGVIPTLAPYVLPWFVQTFARRHPLIELDIVELNTDEILEELHGRGLDVGLLATPLEETGLRERPLFEDPFYLYAAIDEPILSKAEVRPGDLEPDKMWLLEDGHCLRHQTLALCTAGARGAFDTVRFAGGSIETLQNLIDASEGYTAVPETFARLLPRGRRRDQIRAFAEPTPTRQVGLVHLKSTWKADLIDALQTAIADTLPRPFMRSLETSRVLPVR